MDITKRALGRNKIREIDRKAIDEYEIPGIILMENAGRNVAEEVLKMLSGIDKARVAIFCGKGNNGGDGFVIARHLYNKGVNVSVFLTTEISRVLSEGDASTNLKILLNMNFKIRELKEEHIEEVVKTLHDYNIIVDAIFGTGLSGEVREPVRTLIEKINETDIPVVSVDIPSGLGCDDGVVLGVAVKAAKTVTFVAPKTGFFQGQGKEYTGELIVSDISVPKELTVS
ncbi:carbohydrate kinase [Candidatus Scalindua japonica]|uniref:NAD(P)H-hydrate epimerase n=1 Tax=Candidatus Scalindua japonica TaxID=1284222 RepID=A0A286U0Z1_9BACT|nr:NAD(P)H-hydrate epimerase [Candidatus Scalindua japonica]GAX61804.1 carbohydrate kinase [Candidatus Scalindua japonica]